MKNKKAEEIILYLVFGALTTAVSMATYFGILWLGESLLAVSPSESEFYYVRIVAEILQWIFAVLFAFFTNKKWVFTDADKTTSPAKQLSVFAGGRLITLGLDALVTFGTVAILQSAGYAAFSVNILITVSITADLISKVLAAVLVVIANYFISKLFVFKKAK